MSAYATALLESSHKDVVEEALRQSDARAAAEACISALEAEVARLRAEIARKDEALQPFANLGDNLDAEDRDDFSLWEHWAAEDLRCRDLRRARTALGPWRPTHQHANGTLAREVLRASFGYGREAVPCVILEHGNRGLYVVAGEKFDRDFRPLTPDEQDAYVEAAMGERT